MPGATAPTRKPRTRRLRSTPTFKWKAGGFGTQVSGKQFASALETMKIDLSAFRVEAPSFEIVFNPEQFIYRSPTAPVLEPSVTATLQAQIAQLKRQVDQLRSRLESSAAEAELVEGLNEEVSVAPISRDEAKEAVLAYFVRCKGAYPSDAVNELGLDALLVLDLCQELEEEGYLSDYTVGERPT